MQSNKNILKFLKKYKHNICNNYEINISFKKKTEKIINNLSDSKYQLESHNFYNTNNDYLKNNDTYSFNLNLHYSINTTPSVVSSKPRNQKLIYT